MSRPYPIAKRYKQLLLALIYSSVIAYLMTACMSYQSYSRSGRDLTISIAFLTGVANDMLSDIGFVFLIYGIIPFFLLIPIIYLFVLYKFFSSEIGVIEKHRLLLLTLSLALFYLLSRQFAYFIAASA